MAHRVLKIFRDLERVSLRFEVHRCRINSRAYSLDNKIEKFTTSGIDRPVN